MYIKKKTWYKNMVNKANGSVEPFDIQKIFRAVDKAFGACGMVTPKPVYNRLEREFDDVDDDISVEQIQDKVENVLMDTRYSQVAKAYIIYRYEHKKTRQYSDDKIRWITKYKHASNTANSTIDDNSNVSGKNIGILNAEAHKEDNIPVVRRMVTQKLAELYPDFDPKQYERDLEDHIIYKHDESSFVLPVPYCASITMYPFLADGIRGLGGLSAAPKNLDSFCGMYANLIFAISAGFAGAIATSEFLLYFDYFARKEWGNDYWEKTDCIITSEHCNRPMTIKKQIHQHFQQVIYSINQPAAARGLQSAFINFSYFDKPFFDGMFGDFYFPDGTAPIWESLCWLQKDFMQWFNAERLKCILTFPVESVTLLYKDGEFQDKDMFRFVCEEYARGHSFFTYISDTVDSLSSCCFDGSELIKVTNNETGEKFNISLQDFVNMLEPTVDKAGFKIKENYSIMSFNKETGSEETANITGILKKEYTGPMYEITTEDNKTITVTADHLLLVKHIPSDTIMEIPAATYAKQSEDYLLAIS